MPIHEVHLMTSSMQVVALAGGVGGARLADGLAQVLPPEHLTVIVNVGDDFEHLGLRICPDLDTVCYTLAGIANPETGWGRVDESWQVLQSLEELGGLTWFRLGDRDLALHLERTERLRMGLPLSQVTYDLCNRLGVQARVLPVTNDAVPTMVLTKGGELPFQEYFVRQRCEPEVSGFRFAGVQQASPAPGVVEALQRADLVVLCPSNPWVSSRSHFGGTRRDRSDRQAPGGGRFADHRWKSCERSGGQDVQRAGHSGIRNVRRGALWNIVVRFCVGRTGC